MAATQFGVYKHQETGVRMMVEIGGGEVLTIYLTPHGGGMEQMVYDSMHKPDVRFLEEMHAAP